MRKAKICILSCLIVFLFSTIVVFASGDTVSPTGRIVIENGDQSIQTTERNVFLNISAQDNIGVAQMMLSNSSRFEGAEWENYSTEKFGWMLSEGYGVKRVYIKFKDEAGNTSNIYSDTIEYVDTSKPSDTVSPTGRIVIENGDQSIQTTKRNVFLNISAQDNIGVTQMMLSNSSRFEGAEWENYSTEKFGWMLSEGYGIKKVYIKFKDEAGNTSRIYSDTIEYSEAKLFKDIMASNWAFESINEMAQKGIIAGYPDGTFKPNNLVTREQFAKIMVLALNLEVNQNVSSSFSDVKSSYWAFKYIETAKPYLTGYQRGKTFLFKGQENAVREDMAVALVKALKLENEQIDINEADKIFTDSEHISPELKKYVLIAYKNNLISGYSDNTFKPQGKLTRAEAAALLFKVLKSEVYKKVAF